MQFIPLPTNTIEVCDGAALLVELVDKCVGRVRIVLRDEVPNRLKVVYRFLRYVQ